MPVYVYQCSQCGYQFEQQQKFSDKPLRVCPQCEMSALHKVYTPVGIIYKGSGFYSTDHRSSSGNTSTITPKKAESGTKTEGEKKKTEKKAEIKE